MDASNMQEKIARARARARRHSEICGNANSDEKALCARQRQQSDPNPEKIKSILAHKAVVHGHKRRHVPTIRISESSM